MKRGARGCLTIIGGFVVLIVVIGVIAAVAGSSKSGSGKTSSPALVTSSSAAAAGATPTPKAPAKPQIFTGTGTENIGTVVVSTQSTLHWTCATCSSDNFIVGNDFSDANMIDVNALNQASGQTVVDAGTYHNVMVNTEGQAWTIRIVPGT